MEKTFKRNKRPGQIYNIQCTKCGKICYGKTEKTVLAGLNHHLYKKHEIESDFHKNYRKNISKKNTLGSLLKNAKYTDMAGVLVLWSSHSKQKRHLKQSAF